MIKKTKFYYELEKAKTDEVALINVINTIMPIIESNSFDYNGKFDEDLRSHLLEYCIETVKKDGFAEKFLRE